MPNDTPLINLVSINQLEEVRELLAGKDCNINEVDDTRTSALHMAASNNNTEMVKLLLESGADPCVFNDLGQTPLSIAKAYRNDILISILSEAESKQKQKQKFK